MESLDFSDLKLPSSDVAALRRLAAIRRSSEEHLAIVLQFPEVGFRLDFDAARAGSELRQFKHAHQMCLMHTTHLEMATKIKATYILDSYLWAVMQLNPIAVYSSARSLMELRLITAYVGHLLVEAQKGSGGDWRERGERFFNVILQARFGTSDPDAQHLLQANGCPETIMQPFRIAKARAFVAQQHPWVREHYALLSDFVHPNLSSQRTAGAYAGEQEIAHSSGGGKLIMTKPSPVIQYQFPMPEPGRRAVSQTATRALENMLGIVESMNEMPRTPYAEDELVARTGSPLGMTMPTPPTVPVRPSIGRNEPCPCGSGKKYKKCHGGVVPN